MFKYSIIITIFISVIACGTGGKKLSRISDLKKSYELAQKSSDYPTAISILTELVATDSTQQWAWDSLAWFHYFYAGENPRFKNSAALHIAQIGLKSHPQSTTLKHVTALCQSNDLKDSTSAIATFNALWNSTQNYTYYYDLQTYNLLLALSTNNSALLNKTDSIITTIARNKTLQNTKMQVSDRRLQISEEAPVCAAFWLLKANEFFTMRQFERGALSLDSALSLHPNFGIAKTYKEQLLAQMQQNQQR